MCGYNPYPKFQVLNHLLQDLLFCPDFAVIPKTKAGPVSHIVVVSVVM